MFCIGLYARHTFRKVEPSVVADVSVAVCQLEKAIQTEPEAQSSHVLSAVTPTYNSDSEESLCRIEHASLDGFSFPEARGRRQCTPGGMEPNGHQNVNSQDCMNVTVVWAAVDIKWQLWLY